MDSVCLGYDYIPIINTPDWGLIHIQPTTNNSNLPLYTSTIETIPTNNPILQPIATHTINIAHRRAHSLRLR